MIPCPVEIVDCQSALIAADWYEENSQEVTANQIRFLVEAINNLNKENIEIKSELAEWQMRYDWSLL